MEWLNCLVCESYLHIFVNEMTRTWKGLTLALRAREEGLKGGSRWCGLLGDVTHRDEGSGPQRKED